MKKSELSSTVDGNANWYGHYGEQYEKSLKNKANSRASLVAPDGKEFACNAGDLGLTPGLGKSPREGNGYPLQDSVLENSDFQ